MSNSSESIDKDLGLSHSEKLQALITAFEWKFQIIISNRNAAKKFKTELDDLNLQLSRMSTHRMDQNLFDSFCHSITAVKNKLDTVTCRDTPYIKQLEQIGDQIGHEILEAINQLKQM